MKHFSNILSLRRIFLKKLGAHVLAFWNHFGCGSYVLTYDTICATVMTRFFLFDKTNIESKSENYGEWWTLFVLVLRCPFTWINRRHVRSLWRKKKRRWWVLQGNDDVLCVIRYSSFSLLSLLQLFWAEDVDSTVLYVFAIDGGRWHRISELHHRILEFKFIGIIALKTWNCSCHSDVIIICCTRILCQSCLYASWWDVIFFIPGFLSIAA